MSKQHTDTEYPKIDLMEILHGLFKSAKRFFALGIALILAASALLCFRTWHAYTPRYTASTSFTVKVVNPLYATQQYYNNAAAEQMAATFPQILTSGLLRERVMEKSGIGFLPSIGASAMGNTNIFTLSVTDTDPERAYEVLNCVIEIYPSVAEFVVGPTTLTLLSETGVPGQPDNAPSYRRAVMTGAMLGSALWLCIALVFWITHRTINSEEDLSKVVSIPCLGHLPKIRGISSNDRPILTDSNDKFGFNESVRLLRVRVEKALNKEKGNILMVTSSIPNEGKTTVSVNLAMELASKEKRVLLVDCDLRKPSVGEVFGLDDQVGFSQFLKGECSLTDAFHLVEQPNLFVIPGGFPTDHPEKLLANENAKLFIDGAKNTVDYIILDTPPCAMMADAAEIGTLADGTLLVVRQDFASRQQIHEAVQSLSDLKQPIIGTVLFMTPPKRSKHNYGSYYGYGYGYGHYGHYGDEAGEEEIEDEKAGS